MKTIDKRWNSFINSKFYQLRRCIYFADTILHKMPKQIISELNCATSIGNSIVENIKNNHQIKEHNENQIKYLRDYLTLFC